MAEKLEKDHGPVTDIANLPPATRQGVGDLPYTSEVAWVRYGALEEMERRMALQQPETARSMRLNKRLLQKAVAEMNDRSGFVKDPCATADRARQLMLDTGVNPENKTASAEIIRMREEKLG